MINIVTDENAKPAEGRIAESPQALASPELEEAMAIRQWAARRNVRLVRRALGLRSTGIVLRPCDFGIGEALGPRWGWHPDHTTVFSAGTFGAIEFFTGLRVIFDAA